jgi:Flp pilus assembly pilin Flp
VAKQSSMFDLDSSSFAAQLCEDENAQTMAEYAVILTVITASIFLAIALLGTNVASVITNAAKLVLP